MSVDTIPAIVAFSVFAVAGVGAMMLTKTGSLIRGPIMSAFVIHAVVAFAVFHTIGLFAPDAMTYDTIAQYLTDLWSGRTASSPTIAAGKEGFPLILAALYQVFGHAPELGLIINVTASTALVPVVAATAGRLGGSVRAAAWITALFPPFILWGGLLLRESLSWLLIALAAYAVVRLVDRANGYWVLLAGSLLGMLWIRGTAAIIIGAAMLVGLIVARRKASPFLVVVIIAATLASGPLAARLDEVTGGYSIEQINASRAALARDAATGSFPVVGFTDPVSMITALPGALPRVLFGPYPWEWPGVGAPFALDAALWLLLIFLTYRGWKKSPNRRRLVALLLPAAALLVVLAVTSGNYGTMQRLRVQAAVLLIPAASIVWRKEPDKLDGRASSILPVRAVTPNRLP